MTNRLRTALTVSGAVAATVALALLIAYYYTHDPASAPAPKCIFKMVTGWDCPGCGSQRAFHAILHGNIAAAWHFNPFVFFAVPGAAFYITVEAMRKRLPRLHSAAINPFIIAAITLAAILYTVLRNIL